MSLMGNCHRSKYSWPVQKNAAKKMNLPFQDENIDRVHMIGETYTDKKNFIDKNTGKIVKFIIVNSKSWKFC